MRLFRLELRMREVEATAEEDIRKTLSDAGKLLAQYHVR
jgi:hypothetical protein